MSASARADLLTSGQAASLLRVSPKTVNRWARQGLLRSAQTLGGHLRFRRADVEAAMRQMLGDYEEPGDSNG